MIEACKSVLEHRLARKQESTVLVAAEAERDAMLSDTGTKAGHDDALQIVVAHDYLTQRGGAERVTLEIVRALSPKYLVTAIFSADATFPAFKSMEVRSTVLSRSPRLRKDARLALPFLATAWSMLKPITADVVVCSSSGWAHGVPTGKTTRKIVYCHNPARWLYQTEDYLLDRPWYIGMALRAIRPFLVRWDRRAAKSAHIYIANSTSVAQRIHEVYGRAAQVLFPPVSIDARAPVEPVPGLDKPFFLMVGRSRGYKGAQPLIEAFRKTPDHTLVVAGGSVIDDAPPNVICTGFVSEPQLRWLYSQARALISVSHEDFGLTPIEANAFGTPVLLLRAGGFIDSTDEGVSGLFIEDETPDAIREAVCSFPHEWDRTAILEHAGKFSASMFHQKMQEIVRACCDRSSGR